MPQFPPLMFPKEHILVSLEAGESVLSQNIYNVITFAPPHFGLVITGAFPGEKITINIMPQGYSEYESSSIAKMGLTALHTPGFVAIKEAIASISSSVVQSIPLGGSSLLLCRMEHLQRHEASTCSQDAVQRAKSMARTGVLISGDRHESR